MRGPRPRSSERRRPRAHPASERPKAFSRIAAGFPHRLDTSRLATPGQEPGPMADLVGPVTSGAGSGDRDFSVQLTQRSESRCW
jgi:hypothetical protein